MGAMSGMVTSAQQRPGLSTHVEPELLPEVVGGMMESPSDTACPSWQSTTQAKEILVYLTGAVKVVTDANQDILTRRRAESPETAAAMMRMIQKCPYCLT